MTEFAPRVNEDNPDPRIACALLLDTSGSMSGSPIEELNKGFELFCQEIKDDELAAKRAEIAVITFGGQPQLMIPFTEGRDLAPQTLTVSGATPLGQALNLALDELEQQKDAYRKAGLEYYRPWLFVLTDGQPTDGETFTGAAARLRDAEAKRHVSVFCIGIGEGADLKHLEELSAQRKPLRLEGLSFREFFSWLSASLGSASASTAFGSSDSSVATAEENEQIPLPPAGWASA
ncbi:MAG: VWA domain-containing protein [Streptosporangiaceae bacterium]|jgi:uncharacterized protein YegL